jgi:very-short-patch-repair endonuclease
MHYRQQQEIARDLRKSPTPAEKVLWQRLRKKAICNQKFLRQVVMRYEVESNRSGFFIVDFFCPEQNMVIEVDGDIHQRQEKYDRARDHKLKNLGCLVLRFTNDEIFFNMDNVIQTITNHLTQPPDPLPWREGEPEKFYHKS